VFLILPNLKFCRRWYQITVFWYVTPCNLVGMLYGVGEMCCLHLER